MDLVLIIQDVRGERVRKKRSLLSAGLIIGVRISMVDLCFSDQKCCLNKHVVICKIPSLGCWSLQGKMKKKQMT